MRLKDGADHLRRVKRCSSLFGGGLSSLPPPRSGPRSSLHTCHETGHRALPFLAETLISDPIILAELWSGVHETSSPWRELNFYFPPKLSSHHNFHEIRRRALPFLAKLMRLSDPIYFLELCPDVSAGCDHKLQPVICDQKMGPYIGWRNIGLYSEFFRSRFSLQRYHYGAEIVIVITIFSSVWRDSGVVCIRLSSDTSKCDKAFLNGAFTPPRSSQGHPSSQNSAADSVNFPS